MLITACPSCSSKLGYTPENVGKNTRCPKCATVFVIAPPPPPEAVILAEPQPDDEPVLTPEPEEPKRRETPVRKQGPVDDNPFAINDASGEIDDSDDDEYDDAPKYVRSRSYRDALKSLRKAGILNLVLCGLVVVQLALGLAWVLAKGYPVSGQWVGISFLLLVGSAGLGGSFCSIGRYVAPDDNGDEVRRNDRKGAPTLVAVNFAGRLAFSFAGMVAIAAMIVLGIGFMLLYAWRRGDAPGFPGGAVLSFGASGMMIWIAIANALAGIKARMIVTPRRR